MLLENIPEEKGLELSVESIFQDWLESSGIPQLLGNSEGETAPSQRELGITWPGASSPSTSWACFLEPKGQPWPLTILSAVPR